MAQIVTYGTIKAKQALKDSSRVLGFPFGMGEKLTKAMPPAVMGKDIPLSGILDSAHPRYKEAGDIRALVETDPEAKTVFETALGLENLKRQWGVHAAGVIMSSDPLIDIIPIMKREQDGQIVTQFDYPACEALGLIKMDFLGLRNLTIIDDALDNIEANRGFRPVLEDLALDDPSAYELLGRGDTLGVFQLDGGPMRSLLRLMKPDNFEDISAVIALYRPGPMGANSHTNYALRKNALQPITPIHPELEEPLHDILDTSYGLIIYQEQVMAIAQRVAGFSLGQADILRRAMGKKKKSELDKQYAGFSAGMKANGYSDAAVKTLWDILLPFSDYAFNKAHSAAYGVLSYWTAYLKAQFPAEYMAALLTSVGDARDKLALYLNECRRMGIKVLPPDVNESIGYFAAVGDDIRFGLGAVRNVGFNVVDAIRGAREQKGRFESFHDFLKKSPLQVANKRTVESLVKAGAFDSLGATRRALIEIHESAVESAVAEKRVEATGQAGFDFDSPSRRSRPAAGLARARATGVGQARQAGIRARDARPLRLRPPPGGARGAARQARIHDDHRARRVGLDPRRRHRHHRRPGHERAAPGRAPERQPVRDDPGRGLLGRAHRDVHGQGLPGVRPGAEERLDRGRARAGEPSRRRHEPARLQRVLARARPGRRVRTGRHLAARRARHDRHHHGAG